VVVALGWAGLAGAWLDASLVREAAASDELDMAWEPAASVRGLATFTATTVVVIAVALPFTLATGRAWEHVRSYLLFGADAVQLTSAIVVLVATWVLGLTILGAALALRATAWTAEVTAG
jgi:hypothetical protein